MTTFLLISWVVLIYASYKASTLVLAKAGLL
jgi:hypothetical protein